ncbi:type IV secretion system DNA-binding domain-containing protein [Cupriavidus metallidurans]|nr:type IV secretion system DNA-binding domain-containing protein [Cupriavidus metallidurans]
MKLLKASFNGKGAPSYHPDVPMGVHELSNGAIIAGSPGSGKTQVLKAHIWAAYADKSRRVLTLDVKPDFWAEFGSKSRLLFPLDCRSMVWDIAADVKMEEDASEFARFLIPDAGGDNAFFTDSGRGICAGLIRHVQRTTRGDWTALDLYNALIGGAENWEAWLGADELNKIANCLYTGADDKLKGSIQATILASAENFGRLARCLERIRKLNKALGRKTILFSVRDFMQNPKTKAPRTILRADKKGRSVVEPMVCYVIGRAANLLDTLPESAAHPISINLDELPQIGKIDDLPSLHELGRSKGVCTNIVFQDGTQMDARYGKKAESMLSNPAHKLVLRTNPNDYQEKVAKQLGSQTVEYWASTVSQGGGSAGATFSGSWQEKTRPLYLASELQTRIGPRNIDRKTKRPRAIRYIWKTDKGDCYEVDIAPRGTPEGVKEVSIYDPLPHEKSFSVDAFHILRQTNRKLSDRCRSVLEKAAKAEPDAFSELDLARLLWIEGMAPADTRRIAEKKKASELIAAVFAGKHDEANAWDAPEPLAIEGAIDAKQPKEDAEPKQDFNFAENLKESIAHSLETPDPEPESLGDRMDFELETESNAAIPEPIDGVDPLAFFDAVEGHAAGGEAIEAIHFASELAELASDAEGPKVASVRPAKRRNSKQDLEI